ncbi:GPW/gp25 family protein [Cronobacter malonaticus]|uniref:type VI secretion system baseplate subunit TssE n=1 Tax=Cronobacter malonaticus TaxID=413503 RepID=UPI000CFC6936|nr:GPW/gp25 family protein [Cronobacter malonaticus]ELQ6262280.1 GPW/gp25 family protein [Cronobacter malonaticus]ELY2623530.1 GPW/gp25 family protein [Cronobacter malonaticus]ELY2767228.1 GPW/gp25 family protein [Cronobacter malonaticus]ELY3624458.1 GPW/gp25 family protein [Cronobacter malonaticus]ELY4598874.1 GPW/gp25 family protein [Cronobacter malonaticus]
MERKKQFAPTLLDRLLDDEPKARHEAYDASFTNARRYRQQVLRDIDVLLNNTNIETLIDPVRHPAVVNSVINHGLAPLSGKYATPQSWAAVEQAIRNALLRFEPRIIPASLVVRPKRQSTPGTTLLFEIAALLYWQPEPVGLVVSGSYDTETEKTTLKAL